MITSEQIASFLQANPQMSDREIAQAMDQFGVNTGQLAQAVGMPVADVQRRYDDAAQDQQVFARGQEILGAGGTAFDIAREAKIAGLKSADLSKAFGVSEAEIQRLSSGVMNETNLPMRPTFSGVASEWNATHKAKFGTYLNLARADDKDVQNQVAQLKEETSRRQGEWDSIYGETPEGSIIKDNPPPDWRDIYEPWLKTHVEEYGGPINRDWASDQAAINQKAKLDQDYIKSIDDYNKKFGTNITPDPYSIGTFAQPNEFFQAPKAKDKWYKDPVKLALAAAAIYFGGTYLLSAGGAAAGGTAAGGTAAGGAGAAGTAGAAGAAGGVAGGTGLTIGAGGATGLTAGATGAGFVAPAGFTLAPGLGTSLAVAGAGTASLLDGALTSRIGETGLLADASGIGLTAPTAPGLSAMGGAQGLTVPVAGGTVSSLGFVPAGAAPILGSPGSFINNPDVLGRAVFGTDTLALPGQTGGFNFKDAMDIARGLNTANNLLSGDQEQQQRGLLSAGTQLTPLPFPSLFGPSQVGLLPLAEQFRRSLLG